MITVSFLKMWNFETENVNFTFKSEFKDAYIGVYTIPKDWTVSWESAFLLIGFYSINIFIKRYNNLKGNLENYSIGSWGSLISFAISQSFEKLNLKKRNRSKNIFFFSIV